MIEICPNPPVWAKVWQDLREAAKERGIEEKPPTPLILTGWCASNDLDKKLRWEETVVWARKRGLEDKVRVAIQDMYRTVAFYRGPVGPLGGAVYLPWRSDPVERPDPELLRDRLAALKGVWRSLEPRVVTQATDPIRFTGKTRRLEVQILDPSVKPPWGTWTRLAPNPNRKNFTSLRAALNQTLRPHEVDHVAFVVNPGGTRAL